MGITIVEMMLYDFESKNYEHEIDMISYKYDRFYIIVVRVNVRENTIVLGFSYFGSICE